MHSRTLLLALELLGAALPGSAIAQSYSSGLNIPPLPVVPGLYPSGAIEEFPAPPRVNVNLTVSNPQLPPLMSVALDRATVPRRNGCEVATYSFGSGNRILVHRC
jgi:hypothetical protein